MNEEINAVAGWFLMGLGLLVLWVSVGWAPAIGIGLAFWGYNLLTTEDPEEDDEP